MLKNIGIDEIFLPKQFPQEPNFRSASVSYEEDRLLSIPARELSVLNAQDWYGRPSREAWEIANKYFDVLFFILYKPEIIKNIANNFRGAVLWRAYGDVKQSSYGKAAVAFASCDGAAKLKSLGRRFWFAQAYPHLHEIEPHYISTHRVYLPLGLVDVQISNEWKGEDKRVYFVCPDVEINTYYREVFLWFKNNFSGVPHAIGGAQTIRSNCPEVLGYLPLERHQRNMQDFRLMFYHSTEPNHVHYHPFEAIRAGMPLLFMAGGMLDRMGGKELPGRCIDVREARAKIARVLDDDWNLIDKIRQSQKILLEPMKIENCQPAWQDGFQRILSELKSVRLEQEQRRVRPKRIAVIVPIAYRGGSLRGAKLLAEAIYQGSRQANEAAEVVLLHLVDEGSRQDEMFDDLVEGIFRRAFRWQTLDMSEARRAMRYAGCETWKPEYTQYLVPDDGIMQLTDCDLWVIVSDRLRLPLLPLRPFVLMVYDYAQRYFPQLVQESEDFYLASARQAERLLVTTEFTRNDALQYAGVPSHKVAKLPLLAPAFSNHDAGHLEKRKAYFVWTTNRALHKNHANALKALRCYYEKLGGSLDCVVTGVDTDRFFNEPLPHLAEAKATLESSELLRARVFWQGELTDSDYRRTLGGAAFLWHAGSVDNGTFSVIEAAGLGVPALSSDYPAMREIDHQFALNLAWMVIDDPTSMAEQLKQMELSYQTRQKALPSEAQLAAHGVDKLAGEYWRVIRECL